MPKIEPVYEPRESDGIFDADEDYEDEDGGSRLPLLIVIGLLVLAAFGGVVWLAYQHGLQNGLREAPRLIAGQPATSDQQAYDKIYQKPAPSDEDSSNDDTAPPPPTPTFKPQAATPAPTTPAPSANTAETPAPSTAVVTRAPSPPVKSVQTTTAKPIAPPPVPQSIQPQATKPPAKLVPDTHIASTTPVETKPVAAPPSSVPAPSTPAEAAPAASGGFVLQIGAYKSEDEASSSWKSYKAKHSLAASYPESIKQVDLGAKGTWYRLRIGGFSSKDDATAFCAKLKADGGDCIPAKN